MVSTPQEQVAHAEIREPPLIGEVQEGQGTQASRPETVHSSSTGSSTSTGNSRATGATERMLRQEEAQAEEDEANYWDDVIDIQYTTFNDEIDEDKLLYEG
eukprot:3150642-Amphidinium_carterae.1